MQFDHFEAKHYILIGLLVVVLLMRIFNKKSFILKYKDFFNAFIFIILGVIVGIEFWKNKIYIGIVVLVLAALAIVKVYYDKKNV